MMMITGGRCQGKLDFAQSLEGERKSKSPQVRASVADGGADAYEVAFSASIICHLELYIKRMMEEGREPAEFIERLIRENQGAVVIADEIGSGVVPVDPFERTYRETSGRLCQRIAAASEQVYRVIAGIGMKIKG